MRFPILLAAAGLAVATSAESQHNTRGPAIPQVARAAGLFTTLLTAVEAAGLSEFLLGRGPITVFAPTDEAFAQLPNGTVKELLRPENRERLKAILTYHVVAGRVTAAQAGQLDRAETVSGQEVRIARRGDALRINDATVKIADIPASNGIIHVIDRVLLPAERSASSGPLGVVELAIERGVPLFNNGQVDATIAIYEVASTALLLAEGVSNDARQSLGRALADTRGSARERAFALRAGLDEARLALAPRRLEDISRR